MNSNSDGSSVRLGREHPQIVHTPPDVASLATAEDTIELANAYTICNGHPLSPSQEFRLRNALGERADGSWAAAQVCDFGGRQGSGKTDTIIARELAGLLLFGERLQMHTAHESATAKEAFLRMEALVTNWDDLRRLVIDIKSGNSERSFTFKGGRRLVYMARTNKSGRGFAQADLIVYDEAQQLNPEHVASSAPAKLANPNTQAWWAGSGGFATSGEAWGVRMRALRGDAGRLAYTEHTAEIISRNDTGGFDFAAPDPMDRDAWAQANPGLGRWVTEESMDDMRREIGPLRFVREGLCVWEQPPELQQGPIDVERWGMLVDGMSVAEGDVRLCLDAPPDLMSATFAIVGRREDGMIHGDIRYHVPFDELSQIAKLAKGLCDMHACRLVLPPGSPARAWKGRLDAAGVDLDLMSQADYADACQLTRAVIRDGSFRHRGQVEMDQAVAGLSVRRAGDVDVWARRSSMVNIAPFVALTCAIGRFETIDGETVDYGDPMSQVFV